METLVRLEVLDENMCEGVIRGKIVLKQDVFYIYYPSEFRVDEKIYVSFGIILEEIREKLLKSFGRSAKDYKNEHS